MIRNVLESIKGVDIYPVISLLMFFSIFVVAIFWAIRMSREYADQMSQMPLDKKHE